MILAMLVAGVAASVLPAATPEPTRVRDVVLIHGAVMDGSSWRGVYEELRRDGYRVVVAQLPLTGLDADMVAAREAIARAQGPVLLVGHSYGGAVISVAGDDPKVRALVYVAAHQPDAGESIAELNGRFPLPAHVEKAGTGSIIVAPAHFHADVAADMAADKARFLADAQRPAATTGFTTRLTTAAWRAKPSWVIVARRDRTFSPELERWMYARSKSIVVELDASHSVQISRPKEVAAVIGRAATGTR